ncbi:hypothetical protein RhiirA4_461021 [Rhizophagus irregularis]|uniref:Protein kinase domain-containing protein n=1 Tax=Rhizophagus irregularis TaxID=588596 RepID=A0A2I1GHX5_9GLOM|nr:hypothetical protein RhiirA4_461021 [Rhizophagus irregularis]
MEISSLYDSRGIKWKPYTKAADIYSFGMIMWEFTSGIPAFNNRSHDFNLSLDICKGLRPEIVTSTLPVYARLMKRCCEKRPTADELYQIFSFGNEPITKNHPLSYEEREFKKNETTSLSESLENCMITDSIIEN